MKEAQLAALEAAALAATPGKREAKHSVPWESGVVFIDGQLSTWMCTRSHVFIRYEDAAYIEATEPDVLLALIQEVRDLRGALGLKEKA